MSAPEPSPPESSLPEPVDAAPEPMPLREHRRRVWPAALGGLAFLVLLAGLVWLGVQQRELARRTAPGEPAGLTALRDEVRSLREQLAGLPKPPDLAPLEQRIAALERQRPEPAAPVDIAPLERRLAALEARPAGPSEDVSAKLNQVAADAAAAKAAEADLSGRLAALEARLQAEEQQAAALAERAKRAAALTRAAVALDAGEPLGEIPGAPPALVRFAHAAPPTEARLREAFPAAAAAAAAASRPATEGQSFGARMWLRMRSLVTVRQGDRVLVGPPAARVLGEAAARLDAGDLAGAMAALDTLDEPARDAMAAWRDQARALLDARAALARMARG
jgi:hypothetical protein